MVYVFWAITILAVLGVVVTAAWPGRAAGRDRAAGHRECWRQQR